MSFLSDIGKNRGKKMLKNIVLISLVAIPLLMIAQCIGTGIKGRYEKLTQDQEPKWYLEDGRWIENTQHMPAKRPVRTTTKVTFYHDGKSGKVETNCRDPLDKEIFVEQGESIQVRHVSYHRDELHNRCSFSESGGAVPIYGNRNKPDGMPDDTVRKQFQYDLPFPFLVKDGKKIPAIGGEMIFVLSNPDNYSLKSMPRAAYAFSWITYKGGITYLHNRSGKRLKFNVVYNYMKQYQLDGKKRREIGHDGSTATFEFARYTKDPHNLAASQ